jgi:hypothetical protein
VYGITIDECDCRFPKNGKQTESTEQGGCYDRQYMRANHVRNQNSNTDRAANRSVRLRLFLIPILTLAFYFSPTMLHAQIDLCSLSDGIVLEAGVNHSVLVEVPTNTIIMMEVEHDCDPLRDFTSYNGLHLYGDPSYEPSITWETGPRNNPTSYLYEDYFPVTPDSMEILIELDACPGTRVRITCI